MIKDVNIENEISVIIPIYNEQDNILELYERLANVMLDVTSNYEIIFVNDGSSDNSLLEIIKLTRIDEKVLYIDLSRNFGHQIAVSAGLEFSQGKSTVIMDGDLQDPPELIPLLYEKLKKGYDVVSAKRNKREGESFLKKVTAKIFYRTLESLTNFKIPLDVGDFRLLNKNVVVYLRQMPERNKFLRGQIAWLGFKQTYVVFDRNARKKGHSGYSYSKMFRLAIDGITSFSDKPLLFVSRLGFLISFFSFLVIVYAIFSHFILNETITGWTSLIISSMFIGGIQLLSIGVIGEYISRINNNVNNRPLYIINKTNIVSK